MKNKIIDAILKAIYYGYLFVMLIMLSANNIVALTIGVVLMIGIAYIYHRFGGEKKENQKKPSTDLV